MTRGARGRALTAGETALARTIFGDAIDYPRVRLHRRKWWPLQPANVVMAPDGHLWFAPESPLWSEDFSCAPLGHQGLFVHELTHVWQAQRSGRWWLPLMRHPFCRYGYTIVPGRAFDRYGIEQQAELVRTAFLAAHGGRAAAAELALLPFGPCGRDAGSGGRADAVQGGSPAAADTRTGPLFIGCACDHDFARHTAVMLTSLDINGGVPEATVLVAAFGLDGADEAMIRAGAGTLGARLRFVHVDPGMLRDQAHDRFTREYPLPVLGRLFLPERITVPHARLLTLDSDMIVNASVRPLFDLDLAGMPVAAIHDVPRAQDPAYFNSGLMMIDVDVYRDRDVAARALRWLAAQPEQPQYPDQDALNHIVGSDWVRLDRAWNYFFVGGEPFATPETFEHASIAHFAGTKPWNQDDHAGRPLYDRYLAELRRRMAAAA